MNWLGNLIGGGELSRFKYAGVDAQGKVCAGEVKAKSMNGAYHD